ncbi:MAG: prepilin-type N-terminal cleavage/methylation domain-containing protein [Candidatus Omnitrophica bacterium]|nr:prepilin-type N-terminal cleavage/methylation domain-containing protein [Candidatus Omnitrophota bacterium]
MPIIKKLQNFLSSLNVFLISRRHHKGFTFVEIMIVIAIIMIVSSIAVSSMLRGKVTSNEGLAIVNLRNLYTALQIYYNDHNKIFPQQLSQLSSYISPALATGSKSGYLFVYTYVNEDMFYINANPRTPGRTGTRYFYIDETGIIRSNSQGVASEDDLPTE